MDEQAKHVVDILSAASVIALLVGWIPAVSGLLTIIWVAIRIWETDTVREIREYFRKK